MCYSIWVGRLVVAVGLLTLCAQARAAPPARLVYTREISATQCPDEATIRSAVTTRLGHDPFTPTDTPRKTITITITADSETERTEQEGGKPRPRDSSPPDQARTASPRDGSPARPGESRPQIWSDSAAPGAKRVLSARLVLTEADGLESGRRELRSRSADCAALADAVVLAISLAIDPLHFADGEPAMRGGRAVFAGDRARHAPAVSTAVVLPEVRGRLGAGALASLGSAPGVSFGFTLTGGVRGRRWSMNAEARADLPATQDLPAGGTITTAIYAGTLIPCFHAAAFAGCGLVLLGAQLSHGEFAVSRDSTDFYAALGIRSALEFPLTRKLELQVQADLLATLTRFVFEVDGKEVFSNERVSGALHVAMVGYFK